MSYTRSRRDFLKATTCGLAALGLSVTIPLTWQRRLARAATSRHLQVESVDRTTVRIPFRPAPDRAMSRELPHWRYAEIFEVQLKSGHTGIGETLLYYTWGVSSDEDVKRIIGKNAVSLLWDESLGAGLHIALFDAVGRALDVPVHQLLGKKVHETTPLSWWNIDMPPADMAAECREAHQLGYMAYKTKGRPWYDLWEQVERSSKEVPDNFRIDMDFNDTLLDAERAIPICKEFERYPQIDIYETPIPQGDVAGNRAICEATRVNIALHYGSPPPSVVVREKCADGFVIGGGTSSLFRQASFAAEADLPFWLQLVGTGITAAFSLHCGGVLSHAIWPAVNCHQLYQYSMLTEDIVVTDGFSKVPDTPGLGYELDRDAVAKLRVEKPTERPDPPRMLETRWPDGRIMYTGSHGQVNFILRYSARGKTPFFEKGVTTRPFLDDGSTRWKELYEKTADGPLLLGG